jgi:hypothetical protein
LIYLNRFADWRTSTMHVLVHSNQFMCLYTLAGSWDGLLEQFRYWCTWTGSFADILTPLRGMVYMNSSPTGVAEPVRGLVYSSFIGVIPPVHVLICLNRLVGFWTLIICVLAYLNGFIWSHFTLTWYSSLSVLPLSKIRKLSPSLPRMVTSSLQTGFLK